MGLLNALAGCAAVHQTNRRIKTMQTTKKDYPKIELYFMGNYQASTTWQATCKDAVASYAKKQGISQDYVTARFCKQNK